MVGDLNHRFVLAHCFLMETKHHLSQENVVAITLLDHSESNSEQNLQEPIWFPWNIGVKMPKNLQLSEVDTFIIFLFIGKEYLLVDINNQQVP